MYHERTNMDFARERERETERNTGLNKLLLDSGVSQGLSAHILC